MKKVEITDYGMPENVAHCVEAPDVGVPGAGRDRLRRAGLSDQPGRHLVLPRQLPAAARLAGDPRCRMRRPGRGGRRRGRRHPAGRPRHPHAARELGAAPAHCRRRRDPIARGARSGTGGDAADQSGDGLLLLEDHVALQARRLGDPGRRQFGGRPPSDRARQGEGRAHAQRRAPRRHGRRVKGARRRRRADRRTGSCRSERSRRRTARRSGSASTRFRARPPSASPIASPMAGSWSATVR